MMNVKTAARVVVAGVLLCAVRCPALAQDAPTVRTDESSVLTVTGLHRLEFGSQSAQTQIASDDSTPFLAGDIDGKEVSRVHVKDVELTLMSGDGTFVTNEYLKEFIITVLPESDTLLSIRSSWSGDMAEIAPDPSPEEARTQLIACGESYDGFPSAKPKVDFLRALETVHRLGIGPVAYAKRIVARYVIHTCGQYKRRSVWIIELVYSPPPNLQGSPPHEQSRVFSRTRHIIDAETGEWLLSTNFP